MERDPDSKKINELLGFPALWDVLSELAPVYGKSVGEIYAEVAVIIMMKTECRCPVIYRTASRN
jgi:hypothetical protein